MILFMLHVRDSIKVCCKLQLKGSVVKSHKVAENLPIQQSPSTIVGLYDGFKFVF